MNKKFRSDSVEIVEYTGENEIELWTFIKDSVPEKCWSCQYSQSSREFGQGVYLCRKTLENHKSRKRIPEIFGRPYWCPLLKENGALEEDSDYLIIHILQGTLNLSKGQFLIKDEEGEFHVRNKERL